MLGSNASICPATIPESLRPINWVGRIERLLLLFLLLLFAVRGLIPAWSHLDADFPNYYLVARLWREGYPVERVYDWVWFQRQKDHAGIDKALVGFTPSTLTSALIVLPLSSLSPLQASRCWLVISLGFLLSAAAILKQVTRLTWQRIGVIMFLAVTPLQKNFLLGQVYSVVLFLLALGVWSYFKDRQFLSGVVLASAAAINIYLVLFLVFFAMKKRWRAACGVIAGIASASVLSIYLFGADACRIYLREVFPWQLRGEINDPYAIDWDSLNALVRRLFIAEPELNPAPVAHLPSLYALLHSLTYSFIFIAFLWAIGSEGENSSRDKLEWASYLFLLLLLSPGPLPFHFVALILTVALAVDYLLARGQVAWAGSFVALYALTCMPYDRLYRMNPSGWRSLLFAPRLSFMMVLAGVLLWILASCSETSFGSRLRARLSVFAAVGFAAMTASCFMLTVHHLAGQFDNYRTRVTTVFGSAIAADPAASSDSLFSDALVPRFSPSAKDAFIIRKVHAGSVSFYGGGGDWFHPAAIKDGPTSWAEVATSHGSQIVRFDSSGPDWSTRPLTIEADDAEQPAVSPRGKLLAYVREVRGRGSLWIRRIGVGVSRGPSSAERELAGAFYDVREAAFYPNNKVIFSSRHNRKFRLYTADPETGTIAELSAVTCSARYPSVSSDGQWMAFSCERGGVWQLFAMNLGTAEQRQLTSSACNSVSPTWMPDSRDLIYATDCGRALGITALSRLTAVH
jgi:Glycosyltransferase family 87/WD40-like Beta Propeller Repeat